MIVLRSEIGLAAATGIVCGLLDALALQLNFLSSRGGIDYVPPRLWIIAPLLWILICVAAAAALILVRLRALVLPLLVLIGPGTLLLVRVIAPIRFPFPDTGYLVPLGIWAVVILPLTWLSFHYRAKIVPHSRRLVRGTGLATLSLLLFVLPHPGSEANPASPAHPLPNVVLVFLDTLRYDSSGVAPGLAQQAPNLANFAATSANFDYAFAPFPWTLPSHISVITGEPAESLNVSYDDQLYRGNRKTLAEIFRMCGYATAAVVANGFLNPGTGFARGYDRFEQGESELDLCRTTPGFFIRNFGPYVRVRPCVWNADDVTRRATRAISHLPRPFFLTLNYMDAHIPYNVPSRCRGAGYKPFYPLSDFATLERVNRLGTPLPEDERAKLERSYTSAIRCLDESLGVLFNAIDQSPDRANTIVAVVSDHGEQFGEHNLTLHGNSVYAQTIHVPLLIRGPGVPRGRVAQPVSITDVYDTLLSLSGVARARNPLPMSAESPPGHPVLSVHHPARRIMPHPWRVGVTTWSVVADGLHLTRSAEGREEIYAYATDPEERHNLAGHQDVAARREKLFAAIRSFIPKDEAERRKQFYSLGYMN